MADKELVEKLKQILKKLFQFEKNDLDFGIYRILNIKRKEISDFIEKELFDILKNQNAEIEIEEDIYNNMINFFSRYYDNGDFISKRKYSKKSKYLIPYNGEEVFLYWVNNDQYYIKTAEYFKNYSFKVGKWKINFEITEEDIDIYKQEINDSEKKYFIFYDIKSSIQDNIIIRFGYRGLTSEEEKRIKKEVKKSSINHEYVNQYNLKHINETIEISSIEELKEKHKNINGDLSDKSELEWHLNKYTIKQTSDYFIHKNLKNFLSQELEFYIKNEMFQIDNINSNEDLNVYIEKINEFKKISLKIIEFLYQIEQFQKKIWEKKKFILSTDYCIPLKNIPHNFYSHILKNQLLIKEWKELFNCEISSKTTLFESNITGKQLKSEFQLLTVDTKYFSSDFKANLINKISENFKVNDFFSGILIGSENFQALNLLTNKFCQKIKCIYIDPPYNTGNDGFLYKDRFQHSSWLCMMYDRLLLASKFLHEDGTLCISIDDNELHNLLNLLYYLFGESSCKIISIKVAESTGVKMAHVINSGSIAKLKEYLIIVKRKGITNLNLEKIPKETWDREYNTVLKNISRSEIDTIKSVMINEERTEGDVQIVDNLLKKIKTETLGSFLKREGVKKNETLEWQYENTWRIIRTVATTEAAKTISDEKRKSNTNPFFSIVTKKKKMYIIKNDYDVKQASPRIKILFSDDYLTIHPGDFWFDIKTTGLDKEGKIDFKSGKKPEKLLKRIITMTTQEDDIVMDFFIGSGTTAAVAHKLGRKWIGVDFPDFINNKAMIRMKHVIYGEQFGISKLVNWEGGGSYIIHSIEQYEDSLNNIDFKIPNSLALSSKDYKIKYMLDFETKESSVLLNLDQLENPFEYKLEVEKNNVKKTINANIIETFNYLAGIFVDKIIKKQDNSVDYTIVTGMREEKKIIVIWRNKNDTFDPKRDKEFVEKKVIANDEYDEIFVNGSSLIENAISLDGMFKKSMLGG